MRDQTGLVPCQGLDFGDVIAKRPPLSDFALSPTRIFKIDEALGMGLRPEIDRRGNLFEQACEPVHAAGKPVWTRRLHDRPGL